MYVDTLSLVVIAWTHSIFWYGLEAVRVGACRVLVYQGTNKHPQFQDSDRLETIAPPRRT